MKTLLVKKNAVRLMTTPDDVHGRVFEREKQRLVVGELLGGAEGEWERWVGCEVGGVCVSAHMC